MTAAPYETAAYDLRTWVQHVDHSPAKADDFAMSMQDLAPIGLMVARCWMKVRSGVSQVG
jgi:hypothetical protein